MLAEAIRVYLVKRNIPGAENWPKEKLIEQVDHMLTSLNNRDTEIFKANVDDLLGNLRTSLTAINGVLQRDPH